MPALDYSGAYQYALTRLDTELSLRLYYHSAAHTRYDVVRATERLCRLEGVTDNDRLLLVTAAYFHDIGFVELKEESRAAYQQLNHEALSAQIARTVLPGFGFEPADLDAIEGIIMSTRLPQTPHNLLEQIMADADLDSIGREDFWSTSTALRVEMAAFGISYDDHGWYQSQARFLSSHSYFTKSAHALRDVGKNRNLHEVLKTVALYEKVAHISPENHGQVNS
jgi:uncharacterized protein